MNEIIKIRIQEYINKKKSSEFFSKNHFPDKFIIENLFGYINNYNPLNKSIYYSIELIVESKINKECLRMNIEPTFSTFKEKFYILSDTQSNDYPNNINEYMSGYLNCSKENIINSLRRIFYEEIKNCLNDNSIEKEFNHPIPLNVQDEKLHKYGFGKTKTYYITGLKIINKGELKLVDDIQEFLINLEMDRIRYK
ncbi:MAG: hypothetical protein ACLS2V_11605 [Clostridium paraputrificum]